MCAIHFGLLSGRPVVFSSWRRDDQLVNGFSGISIAFLFLLPPPFRFSRTSTKGNYNFGIYLKTADISFRDKSNNDASFFSLRVLHVDKFSLSIAGNGLCLSLPGHHFAAAAHQIGTEWRHGTAGYWIPNPTQVRTHWRGCNDLTKFIVKTKRI